MMKIGLSITALLMLTACAGGNLGEPAPYAPYDNGPY